MSLLVPHVTRGFMDVIERIGFGWLGDLLDKRYGLTGALCLIDMGGSDSLKN